MTERVCRGRSPVCLTAETPRFLLLSAFHNCVDVEKRATGARVVQGDAGVRMERTASTGVDAGMGRQTRKVGMADIEGGACVSMAGEYEQVGCAVLCCAPCRQKFGDAAWIETAGASQGPPPFHFPANLQPPSGLARVPFSASRGKRLHRPSIKHSTPPRQFHDPHPTPPPFTCARRFHS